MPNCFGSDLGKSWANVLLSFPPPIGANGTVSAFDSVKLLGCPFGKELLFRVDILLYIILIWRSVILVTYSLVPALFGADLA